MARAELRACRCAERHREAASQLRRRAHPGPYDARISPAVRPESDGASRRDRLHRHPRRRHHRPSGGHARGARDQGSGEGHDP
ncbi:MAG: hypothetical protein ACK56F_14290, partial [bacterium]